MSMTKQQILTEAMQLDPTERDEIAEALWQAAASEEFSAEDLAEIRGRVDDLDAGRMQSIPGEQVMREVRERLQRPGQ